MNCLQLKGEVKLKLKPLILNNFKKQIIMKNLNVTKKESSKKMIALAKEELLTIKGGAKAKVKTIDPK